MNIKLDESGDLAVVGNKLAQVEGREEIEQKIIAALTTFKGEWFLDVSVGMPWFQTFFRKNPNVADLRATIIEKIAATQGVTNIRKLDLNLRTDRVLAVDFSVETVDGIIDFSGAIL